MFTIEYHTKTDPEKKIFASEGYIEKISLGQKSVYDISKGITDDNVKKKYRRRFTEAMYKELLSKSGAEEIIIAWENWFNCYELRFPNGEVGYFLSYYGDSTDKEFYFGLDIRTYVDLISTYARAAVEKKMGEYAIPRENTQITTESLLNDFYARCMMIIGKCDGCIQFDQCGGYREGVLNCCAIG